MLKKLKIKHLYLIDPYETSVFKFMGYKHIDSEYKKAQKRVKKWKHIVTFVKDYSENAVSKIPDHLDFIYIDGNHTYEAVKKDIELYYPKVKKGGVIGGHDFVASEQGVVRAAIEFADQKKSKLYSNGEDWWLVKN